MPPTPIQVINLGFVNAFLLTAVDGFVLVDTGVPQSWSSLESALIAAGCTPDRLKLVVLTHGDRDHTGCVPQLRERYHAPIAIHQDDVPMVERGFQPERITRGLGNRIFMLVGKLFMKLSRAQTGASPFSPDILLEDGQSLAEYGLDARVLHMPGHTAGSIVILTADGQLLAGDIFTNNTRPGTAMFIQDEAALRQSMGRIRDMQATTIYPGHGKPFPYEKILIMNL